VFVRDLVERQAAERRENVTTKVISSMCQLRLFALAWGRYRSRTSSMSVGKDRRS
jgi:hypothetical protein